MKEAVAKWEPEARALLRIMAMYMILLHGLREVFGLVPARPRGPGSFMPLDPLGHVGGVLLLVLGLLLLTGVFARAAALILALQCFVAYFYAAAPRAAWPIRNGGIDTLTYGFVFLYLAAAGPGAWTLRGLLPRRAQVALCFAILLLPFCSPVQASAQQTPNSPAADESFRPAPSFSADELAAPPTHNWLKNGGSLLNQNYSPLKQVNRENVSNLKAVWQTHLEGSALANKYSGEAQPVVYNGVLYIVTGADDVFAVSLKTGAILWRHHADLDQSISTVCCGWTSRGVALGDGRVYVGQLDGRLVALDQTSGKTAWSIQAERWQEGYTITAAPLFYDGMVIVGFAGGERAVRGRVKAYDAKDGRLIWTFYTIPGPGEVGHDSCPRRTTRGSSEAPRSGKLRPLIQS